AGSKAKVFRVGLLLHLKALSILFHRKLRFDHVRWFGSNGQKDMPEQTNFTTTTAMQFKRQIGKDQQTTRVHMLHCDDEVIEGDK
ncbi:hypothetical protein PHBOTO_006301, partial [Pseudozyma hubeiensis]